MAFVYHGTPLTPRPALEAVLPNRGACVSFYRPDDVDAVEQHCPFVMYDPGTASAWFAAMRAGRDWDHSEQDPRPYYDWLEMRLFRPGRWAIVYEVPGAPSQFNDGFLNDWPFGQSRGAPVYHMDGPLDRLLRLCERYERVCLGWIGHPKREPVGCSSFRRRMEEVDRALGNRWPPMHLLRGIAVAADYDLLVSTDATTLAQNGHRHDWRDHQYDAFRGVPQPWDGRRFYADELEAAAA